MPLSGLLPSRETSMLTRQKGDDTLSCGEPNGIVRILPRTNYISNCRIVGLKDILLCRKMLDKEDEERSNYLSFLGDIDPIKSIARKRGESFENPLSPLLKDHPIQRKDGSVTSRRRKCYFVGSFQQRRGSRNG